MVRSLLIKPLVSEKATRLQSRGVYSFLVDRRADKVSLKKEIEASYKVQVRSVRTLVQPRKQKTRYTKKGFISGYTTGYKKAYVQLAEGESIDFYQDVK